MIGKILHIGKNLNKARCWRKSLVCPKHLGGVTMLGKYCNFSLFSNLETVFPALKLTRNCYLKWTFPFHENWQFNHKLGPSLYSTNTVPANKIWNQWDFKNPNFIYNSLVNREKSRSVTWTYILKKQFFFIFFMNCFFMKWQKLRVPTRAIFKNLKIYLLIEKNFEKQPKTNTKNSNFKFMKKLGKFMFTVENKIGKYIK